MFGFTPLASRPFGYFPAVVYVSSVSAASDVGTVTVSANASNITPTGVSAATSLGTVVVRLPAVFSVTGVQGVGSVGTSLVWGTIDKNQTPGWVVVPT
jgi:hypothetical protein